MDRFKDAQAQIDTMFERRDDARASDRILEFAKRGVDAPETLSHKEVQQVCYALIVHFAQMGLE